MADRSADITRNALLLIGEDAVFGETRVDMHQRGKRTGEPAPDTPTEPKIKPNPDNSREKNIDDVIVIELYAKHGPSRQ